ncbi:hypothetical protein KJ596_00165 [Patescibacteria group bacterium]|nr:hypothetical protein [Patescibacteria group bacterium]MBU1868555.1 hypothetical protein [Patescibacteria group bacterium]
MGQDIETKQINKPENTNTPKRSNPPFLNFLIASNIIIAIVLIYLIQQTASWLYVDWRTAPFPTPTPYPTPLPTATPILPGPTATPTPTPTPAINPATGWIIFNDYSEFTFEYPPEYWAGNNGSGRTSGAGRAGVYEISMGYVWLVPTDRPVVEVEYFNLSNEDHQKEFEYHKTTYRETLSQETLQLNNHSINRLTVREEIMPESWHERILYKLEREGYGFWFRIRPIEVDEQLLNETELNVRKMIKSITINK